MNELIFFGLAIFVFLLLSGIIFRLWGLALPTKQEYKRIIETVALKSEVIPFLFSENGIKHWLSKRYYFQPERVQIEKTENHLTLTFGDQIRSFKIVEWEEGKHYTIETRIGSKNKENKVVSTLQISYRYSSEVGKIEIKEVLEISDSVYRLIFKLYFEAIHRQGFLHMINEIKYKLQ